MNIPANKSLAGRRVKLKGRSGWGSVELDSGLAIKVRYGMSRAQWEAKSAVIDVDPPFMPDAGAPTNQTNR